jgi:hypothetical protein
MGTRHTFWKFTGCIDGGWVFTHNYPLRKILLEFHFLLFPKIYLQDRLAKQYFPFAFVLLASQAFFVWLPDSNNRDLLVIGFFDVFEFDDEVKFYVFIKAGCASRRMSIRLRSPISLSEMTLYRLVKVK